MRHIFIINPKAGKQDQTARIFAMVDHLRQAHGLDCACLLTDRPGGATDLAQKACAGGEPVRIYACGGDGTAHEVANALAGVSHAAMTCIPAGTGNDFLKNFGSDMPRFRDAEELWDGPEFPLDLIECNGRYCLTIACSGIDAQVAESVRQYGSGPLLRGRGSYLASVAANLLFRPLSHRWTVTLDGEPSPGEYTLVSVCNGRHYGGGSSPILEARMDDGILHTILIGKVSRPTFARLFSQYSAGNYRAFPQIARVVTAREIRIQSAGEDIVTCLDGECFRSQDVHLHLSDKRLRFFGPKGCDPNATWRPPVK